jgi:hypothetical protein
MKPDRNKVVKVNILEIIQFIMSMSERILLIVFIRMSQNNIKEKNILKIVMIRISIVIIYLEKVKMKR